MSTSLWLRDAFVIGKSWLRTIGVSIPAKSRAELIAMTSSGVVTGREYRLGGLSFIGSVGATVISDLPGLIPPKWNITPNHFADNTTPGTTDMSAAIQAAEDYRASVGGDLIFIDAVYRCNSQLRVRTNGAYWRALSKTQFQFYTAVGTDCILVGANNATTPATVAISTVQFYGITAWRVNPGSTSAIWRFQNVTGIQLDHCYGWNGFIDFLFEGCRNTYARNCSYATTTFTGATGSAGVKVTALDMTDATKISGYTFDWRGLLGGGSGVKETSIWLESIDYAVIGYYTGSATDSRIRIHPTNALHTVYNVEIIPGSYTDGPIPTAGTSGIIIDGAGSGGIIDLVRINGQIIAQQDRGLWIKAGSVVNRVTVIGADFHNTLRECIYAEACVGLRLSVIGGSMVKWNYSGTATGDEQHAIRALGGKTLQIIGVAFDANGTAMPAIKATGFEDVVIVDNTGSYLTSTPLTQSGNTRVVVKNNIGNTTWASPNTPAYTPTISFAGGTIGLTYTSQSGVCNLKDDNYVHFSAYVLLNAKGSSTGELRINLPYAAAAGTPYTFPVVVGTVTDPANAVDYRAVVAGGNSYATIRVKLSTGGNSDLNDTHIATNASSFIVTGEYKRA